MTTVNHHARAEDIRFFVDTGENLTGAARRLGISTDGVERWCAKNGMRGELERLRGREPGDPLRSEKARAAGVVRWSA